MSAIRLNKDSWAQALDLLIDLSEVLKRHIEEQTVPSTEFANRLNTAIDLLEIGPGDIVEQADKPATVKPRKKSTS